MCLASRPLDGAAVAPPAPLTLTRARARSTGRTVESPGESPGAHLHTGAELIDSNKNNGLNEIGKREREREKGEEREIIIIESGWLVAL